MYHAHILCTFTPITFYFQLLISMALASHVTPVDPFTTALLYMNLYCES